MRILQRRYALIRRCALGVLLLVPLFFAPGSHPQAAVVTNADGLATGITGLSVGTDVFNISFEFAPYDGLFPGLKVFSNAEDIATAIAAELNAVGAPLLFMPASPGGSAAFAVPQSVLSTFGVSAWSSFCGFGSSFPFCPMDWPAPNLVNAARLGGNPWAIPSTVPLPAALPLFGSALAMLGIVGWRRRRQAAA